MANGNIKSLTRDFLTIRIGTSENVSQVKNTSGDSFEKQLDRTSKNSFDTDKKQTDTAKKSDLNSEVKKNQNVSRKQKELEEKAAVDAAEDAAGSASMVQDTLKELKEAVAKELDISVEELEALMNTMNFNDMDLFDKEKLGMIVLEANGLTQSQDLLFNKAVADEFKNVMALLDEAVTELEQSEIQVSEEGFFDMATGEEIQINDENVNHDELTDAKADTIVDAEQDIPKDILEADGEIKDVKTTDKAAKDNESDVSDNKTVSEKDIQTDAKTQENESAKQNNTGGDRRNHREHNVREGSVISDANVRFNPIEEIQVELADRVGRSQAENIVNQITEQLRFNVNEEFKSMEMQLYPEHLGKVGVQVAIKDGILTAQITAENETVKKAIEAQIVNLKESFNNQGLKVENVEVTIASHSFEENNMHNQDGQSNQGRGRKNRRLNSALVDELNGITDEQSEDAVMEALGNTVSYTA